MNMIHSDSIRQLLSCRPLQTVFDKIYVVDLRTCMCGELVEGDDTVLDPKNYDEWLISLAEKMYKPDAASFFGQMSLKRVCGSVCDAPHRYVVNYRLEEQGCVKEYRLSICYADESCMQLLYFQEELRRDYKGSLGTINELSHCNARFQFLVNRVVEDFIEINIETGQCHVFPAKSVMHTYMDYEKQILWWADHLIVPEERDAYVKEYELHNLTQKLRDNNGYHNATYTTVSETGRNSILIISTLVKEKFGRTQEYIFAYAQDVTQLKAEESRNKQLVDISQQLLTLSQTDLMTGLYNRAACEKLIEEQLVSAENGPSGTMLLVDIDCFKDFNDRYGHSTGDFVLKFVGKTMQDIFRSDDIVSRWGGDEFIVFMRDVYDSKMITGRIERLRVRLRQCKKDNRSLPITVSIGGGTATAGVTLDKLFEYCDKSLYEVKSQGRNSYRIYSE